MNNEVVVKLFPYQKAFMTSKTKETLLLGGIGTGKSWTIAQDIILNARKYPGIRIFLGANIYSQLYGSTVARLTDSLDLYGIPYEKVFSGPRPRIETMGAIIYLYSLEKKDNLRGPQFGLAYIDECCFTTKEVIDIIRGRLRDKIGPRQLKYASSPNGFNYWWEMFEHKDLAYTTKRLIRAKTKDNLELPPDYYTTLLEEYGGEQSPLARQELFGEFVNLTAGMIYNGFDRKKHVVKGLGLQRGFPVYVGVDFNIDKMSATYIQYINRVFYLVKEVQLTHHNANTTDLAAHLVKDLMGYQVYVVPDSTGGARKSSATSSLSDIAILKEHGLNVMSTHNPFIRDRQNNMNVKFRKGQFVVDESCKETIKEIETLSSRDNEGKVTHLSVTAGYVLWKLDPLKSTEQRASRTIKL